MNSLPFTKTTVKERRIQCLRKVTGLCLPGVRETRSFTNTTAEIARHDDYIVPVDTNQKPLRQLPTRDRPIQDSRSHSVKIESGGYWLLAAQEPYWSMESA